MRQLLFFFALISLLIPGCAGLQQEQTLKDIKSRLSELEKAQLKTNAGMEELNNKFLLIHEQVDSNKKTIAELKAMAVPVMPPEELKVVKLEAEEVKKPETRRKETVKNEPAPSPEALYNQAQNLFMAGKLAESIDKFADFILHYPKHTLADNAQYWIGETYYSQKEYQRSVVEFKKVVDNYPNENKAPDALLKVGFSYLELNSREKAAEALKLLIEKYPSSEAAARAKSKLQELQK
ncbi:MAG: tol-pal system protein YbgF [Deltaproteobacteria bacterium]|nr:tol-pal system protein YbgF [Deltaproteobacteria bacterium]